MTEKTDILLAKDSDGIMDISIGSDGDYEAAYGYETSIQMSVQVDGSIPIEDVSTALQRGGWAGNEHNESSEFELGSLLWTKKQSRRTQLSLNESVAAVKDCLAHFVPDRAKNVNVTGNLTVQGIEVEATILRYDNETVSILFKLWETTGTTI